MKIQITISHPKHVHLFKNVIYNLVEKGHKIKIVARDKDVTLSLLETYGLKYELFEKHRSRLFSKAVDHLLVTRTFYKIAKNFNPDILTGCGGAVVAHTGRIIGKPSIVFADTETAKLVNMLTFPFSSAICTPSCYKENLGKKQVRYNGYEELAYLHPNYFKPNLEFLDELNLLEDDKFIILRFISWEASHDIGLRGIKKGTELEFIKSLERYGRVFITSERKLDKKLEKYRITISPEKIHSLLYYAQLYIGEGGTMAAEAAILGTPAIHIESTSSGIATGELSGNFLELRDKYGLLYFYPDQNQALEKAISILEDKNSKKEWQKRREKLLKDKIDVTAWMTDFIERYPESFYEYQEKHEN